MATRDEFDPPPTDPVVADRVRFVMVQPTHPGNIGAAARAMKNMGFSRLVLVDPLRFPDDEARFRAASAVDLVDGAEVVGTLAEAIDDCQLVIGTSARNRRVPWPMIGPREIGERVLPELAHGPVAILFGREASGLTNEELARCQLHLFVPTDPGYPSLNISMAMQLVAWELRSAWLEHGGRLPEPPWDRPWAESAAVEGMIEHLSDALDRTGFTDGRDAGQVMLRLRRLFFRTRLDQVEVNILRGLCTRIERLVPARSSADGEDGAGA
ncbi:MAG: RNA methyltransferase [Pseudomonadales bacterium]|jgi:tRNA (cytidine32/uridine32-2'-O)-methyltransferase|nr:RNA methyltransferase [Pseudomonadales bacterium]